MTFFRKLFQQHRLGLPALVTVLLLILVAILAPILAPYDPVRQDFTSLLSPPSRQHLLGTDELGRDILSRVIFGTRVSLTVSVLAIAIGGTLGCTLGLLAGYYGGLMDTVIMRLVDVLLAFPGLLLAILIAASLGAGFLSVVVAVAVYSIPTFARVMRGATLATREREFVEAARALGALDSRIIVRHILVNSFAPVLVYGTLLMGSAILTASALSFIGVGVPPPAPEWGSMISSARNSLREAPFVIIGPSIAILIAVMSFNILGDALQNALNPKRMRT